MGLELLIIGGKGPKRGTEQSVVPPFRPPKKLLGNVQLVQKKSPRRLRVLEIVAEWLSESESTDFGTTFLVTLLVDVLHERLLVNAKRQHLRSEIERHIALGLHARHSTRRSKPTLLWQRDRVGIVAKPK